MTPYRAARLLMGSSAVRRREWASPAQLREHVAHRLRRIVATAAARVPYYRALFREAGIRPSEISGPEDLARIPVSDTHVLRREPPELMLAEGVDPAGLVRRRSSGATGITMESWLTPLERDRQALYALRVFRAGGYRATDLLLDLTEAHVPPRRSIERLGLYRKRYVPITEDLAIHAGAIAAMRPDVILTLSSLIEILGDAALDQGVRIRPRRIFTVGEHVTRRQREVAREVFGVDPIDVYGATECGPIAFQCSERRGYHVNADSVLLEILDPETDQPVAPGEVGKVVLTGLVSETMPLIRYALGDLAVLREDRCPCGRGLPLLDSIRGRVSQMLLGTDGRRVPPWGPTTVLEETRGVDRFQIVQERAGSLLLRVRGESVDEADVTRRLRRHFDSSLEVTLEYVTSFGATEAGKFEKVISRLSRPEFDVGEGGDPA